LKQEKLITFTAPELEENVQKCLKQEKLITFTAPELEGYTEGKCKIHANNTIKREELLEANLEVMYEVAMYICDPVLKDQICNHEDYEEIDNKQDTLGLLQIIKKTMYSNGEDNTHMGYNHVIALKHYSRVQQERYQSLKECHDQFVAYRKVCEQLGIKVGTSENGGANILKRMKIVNPMQQQKDDAKKAIEEHHAILFILVADKYKYGKLIEEMKNDIIHKKDPFPKTISEASHLLSKWTNNYGGKYNNGKSDLNDGMAFAMVTEEKEKGKDDKNEKSKTLHVSNAKRKGTTPTYALKNCVRHQIKRIVLTRK